MNEGASGTYPNCNAHLVAAGLRITEAADAAGISEASIRRIRNGGAVQATTISKLINALNAAHYARIGAPLNFQAEFVPTKPDGK